LKQPPRSTTMVMMTRRLKKKEKKKRLKTRRLKMRRTRTVPVVMFEVAAVALGGNRGAVGSTGTCTPRAAGRAVGTRAGGS